MKKNYTTFNSTRVIVEKDFGKWGIEYWLCFEFTNCSIIYRITKESFDVLHPIYEAGGAIEGKTAVTFLLDESGERTKEVTFSHAYSRACWMRSQPGTEHGNWDPVTVDWMDCTYDTLTTKQEVRYMIAASIDPYSAKTHYYRARVLRRDGATPVEWVHDDNFGHGYTLDEAKKALGEVAGSINNGMALSYENDESATIEYPLLDDEGNETDETVLGFFEGYDGPGWYDFNEKTLIYREGDRSFSYDVMTYSIEEMREEDDD